MISEFAKSASTRNSTTLCKTENLLLLLLNVIRSSICLFNGDNRRLYLEFFLRTQQPISQPGSPLTSAYASGGGVPPAVVLPLFPFAFSPLLYSLSLTPLGLRACFKRRSLKAFDTSGQAQQQTALRRGFPPFYWTICVSKRVRYVTTRVVRISNKRTARYRGRRGYVGVSTDRQGQRRWEGLFAPKSYKLHCKTPTGYDIVKPFDVSASP